MSVNNYNQHRPSRVEKELLLLRNLPKEFKLGKKDTALGTLLFISYIDTSLVKNIDQYNFEILLKEKFPFQPPLIMSKTNFCQPTLADGRDLLHNLIDEDWKPSMNLLQIIQNMPKLIQIVLKHYKSKPQNLEQNFGQFYIGLQYDINIWEQNPQCKVFSCQELQNPDIVLNSSLQKMNKQKSLKQYFIVITESAFLLLEPDHKIKYIARMVSWAGLGALLQIKRNVKSMNSVNFYWNTQKDQDEWILSVAFTNANDCIHMIQSNLSKFGAKFNKVYEKKKKILEKDVSSQAIQEIQISELLKKISIAEQNFQICRNENDYQSCKNLQNTLMDFYNKAIEYYSALDNNKHIEYLEKLQKLFKDEFLNTNQEEQKNGEVDQKKEVEINENKLENVQQEVKQEQLQENQNNDEKKEEQFQEDQKEKEQKEIQEEQKKEQKEEQKEEKNEEEKNEGNIQE